MSEEDGKKLFKKRKYSCSIICSSFPAACDLVQVRRGFFSPAPILRPFAGVLSEKVYEAMPSHRN